MLRRIVFHEANRSDLLLLNTKLKLRDLICASLSNARRTTTVKK